MRGSGVRAEAGAKEINRSCLYIMHAIISWRTFEANETCHASRIEVQPSFDFQSRCFFYRMPLTSTGAHLGPWLGRVLRQ